MELEDGSRMKVLQSECRYASSHASVDHPPSSFFFTFSFFSYLLQDGCKATFSIEMRLTQPFVGRPFLSSRFLERPFNKSSLKRIVSDLTLLDDINAQLILHNLKKRFAKGKLEETRACQKNKAKKVLHLHYPVTNLNCP